MKLFATKFSSMKSSKNFKFLPFVFFLFASNLLSAGICNSCINNDSGGGGGGGGGSYSCPGGSYNIIYVDSLNGDYNNQGLSWADSVPSLRQAIYMLNFCSQFTIIRVAKGTYNATSYADPDHNFFIGKGVKIYGGYPPGGGTRDHVANPCILTGVIGGMNNTYHVIFIYEVTDEVIIDGFQIKEGQATGSGSLPLTGTDVLPRDSGGGIYAREATNVKIVNCAIYSNIASVNGGRILSSLSNLTLTNSILYANAAASGSAAFNVGTGSTIHLTNCTIAQNGGGPPSGGSVYSISSAITYLRNSIVWQNSTGVYGSAVINHSIVQNGNTNNYNINKDPGFLGFSDLDGPDNILFTVDDGINVRKESEAIGRGNNTYNITTTDIAKNSRILGTIDIGAYEYEYSIFPYMPSQLANNGKSVTTNIFYFNTSINAPGPSWRYICELFPTSGTTLEGTIVATCNVLSSGTYPYYESNQVNVAPRYHKILPVSGIDYNKSCFTTLFYKTQEFI